MEATKHTLLFASRLKKLETRPQINKVIDDKALIIHLQRELAEKNQRLKALEESAGTAAAIFSAPTAPKELAKNADYHTAFAAGTKKRHISDGDAMIDSTAMTTLSRLSSQQASNHLSIPRAHKKLKQTEPSGPLSPLELAHVRDVHSTKAVKQTEPSGPLSPLELAHVRDAHSTKAEQVENATKEIEALRTVLEDKNSAISALETRVRELNADNVCESRATKEIEAALKMELENKNSAISALETRVRELKNATKEIEALRTVLEDKNSAMSALETRVRELKADTNSTISALETRVCELKADNAALRTDLKAKEEDLSFFCELRRAKQQWAKEDQQNHLNDEFNRKLEDTNYQTRRNLFS
jgi:predicted  nucleic acid-binding Zn-ribbon protein